MLCAIPGKQLYEGLIDRLLGVPGTFNLKRCQSCGLLWLDPMPIAPDILKYYEGNYVSCGDKTVSEGASKRRLFAGLRDFVRALIIYGYYGYQHLAKRKVYVIMGRVLGLWPFLRSRAIYGLGELLPFYQDNPQALIVDVGCGRGDYLKLMRDLGWKVLGIELNPVVANITRNKGIPVFQGTLNDAKLTEGSADFVTLSHVIEHLPEPLMVIDEVFRILKNCGKLVIHTPNAQSLCHQVFRKNSYHLDPPRHLFIFSPKSIKLLFERSKFKKFTIKTLTRAARTSFDNSVVIAREGKSYIGGIKPQKGRFIFALRESMLCHLGKPRGEEIELVAQKF
jgi:SAM-dependent methyltransferase